MVFAGDGFPIGHVGDDHLGRFERSEELVDIDGALLVFRIELGVVHLSDVVIEGRGAAEKAVGADCLGARFGEIAEDEANADRFRALPSQNGAEARCSDPCIPSGSCRSGRRRAFRARAIGRRRGRR